MQLKRYASLIIIHTILVIKYSSRNIHKNTLNNEQVEAIKENIEKLHKKALSKNKGEKYLFSKNDTIFIKNEATNKFDPTFIGPFKILEIKANNNIVEIKDRGKSKNVSIKKIIPFKGDEDVMSLIKKMSNKIKLFSRNILIHNWKSNAHSDMEPRRENKNKN